MTYQEAKNIILGALMNRPIGTEVQVENHQAAEIAILDYARQIQQSIGASLFVDFTYFNEEPYIPQTGYALYIGYIAPSSGTTTTLNYFFDVNGDEYEITTTEQEFVLVFLLWNGTYWDLLQCNIPIVSSSPGTTYTAGDYITIDNNNEISGAEQAYNAVSPGSTPPAAGELIPANSLVMLGLNDSKIYNIVGNTNRACEANWGLAFLTTQTTANSSPEACNLRQQGLLSVSAGMLYGSFVDGAAYYAGFTEDTIDSTLNQSAIKPTGKLYTFSELYTAKINTYMYVGRGTVISSTNKIQLDISAHLLLTRTAGGVITHINGAGTGVIALTKSAILTALGYEELTDIVLQNGQGKGFSANIIGEVINPV